MAVEFGKWWWQVMTKDNEIGYIHKSKIKKR